MRLPFSRGPVSFFHIILHIGCPQSSSLGKTLMLGKIEGRRRRERQRMRQLDGITNSIHTNLGKLWEMVRNREAWHAAAHGVSKSRVWLGNWTTKHTHGLLVETAFMFPFLVSNPLKWSESIETHVKQSDWRVIFRFYYYFPTTYYCLTYTWWNSIFKMTCLFQFFQLI